MTRSVVGEISREMKSGRAGFPWGLFSSWGRIRRGYLNSPSRAMVAMAFATCSGVVRMLPSPIPKNLLSDVVRAGRWLGSDISVVGLELEIVPWVCLKVLSGKFFRYIFPVRVGFYGRSRIWRAIAGGFWVQVGRRDVKRRYCSFLWWRFARYCSSCYHVRKLNRLKDPAVRPAFWSPLRRAADNFVRCNISRFETGNKYDGLEGWAWWILFIYSAVDHRFCGVVDEPVVVVSGIVEVICWQRNQSEDVAR